MNRQKGFTPVIIAVVLLVAAVGAGVILVGQRQNFNQLAKQPRASISPSSSPNSSPALATPTINPSASPDAKIRICHVPPGSVTNAQTIEISKNAWETGHDPHKAHSLDFVMTTTSSCPPKASPSATPRATLTPTPKPTATPGL